MALDAALHLAPAARPAAAHAGAASGPAVEIVIPVYNELAALPASVRRLQRCTASPAACGAVRSSGALGAPAGREAFRAAARRAVASPRNRRRAGSRPADAAWAGPAGIGGLLDSATPSKALVGLLQRGADGSTWVAAAVGSNSPGVQLATGEPVMAIGGFNATDPTPTLAEFQADVAAGKIHYFLAGGNGGMGGGVGRSGSSSAIAAWVEQTFTATTVGGVTVYDLTASAAGT